MAATRKPCVLQQLRGLERRLGIAEHHRDDRARRLRQVRGAGERLGLGDRQRRVVGLVLDHVERGDRRRDRGRRQAGRIDQGARAVAHQVDHRVRGAEIAAIAADAPWTACPSAAGYRPACLVPRNEPRPSPSTPRPWASSDISQASCRCASADELVERREVAIHREHAVGDHQRVAMTRRDVRRAVLRHDRRRSAGRACTVARDSRAPAHRQACDSSSIRIRSSRPDQHRDDAGVGEIAGAEHAGGLGALPARQPGFEFGVERMVAGHQPRGAGADAVDAAAPGSRLP